MICLHLCEDVKQEVPRGTRQPLELWDKILLNKLLFQATKISDSLLYRSRILEQVSYTIWDPYNLTI